MPLAAWPHQAPVLHVTVPLSATYSSDNAVKPSMGQPPKVTVELHHADVALTATPAAGFLPDTPSLDRATVTELVGALRHTASDMFACIDFAVRLRT